MHVKSLVLGAAVAFQASTAVAEAPRPRIYFPRHVKRQFTNTTTTSPELFPPAESTPFETRSESRNFVTSFRNTVTDFLTSNSESSAPTSSDDQTPSSNRETTIIVSTTREPFPAPTSPVTSSFFAPGISSTTDAESADETTQESSSDETTVTERNSSIGGLPTAILQPTDTEEEPTTTTSRPPPAATTSAVSDEETTSNTPVIVIGPTGVVSSSSSTPTTSPSSTRSSAAEIETSTAESVNTTTVAADETTTSSSRVPTTSDAAPTTESSSTPEAAVTTSSAANTTSEADAVTTSSPAAANTTSEAADVTTSSAATTSAAADPARSSEAVNTDAATTEAATTTSRLLDPIVSIISDLVPSVPANDTETTTTQLADPTTTLVEATTTSDGADVTSLPNITDLPTILEPSITPNTTETDLPPGETSTPPAESSVPISEPPTVTTISSFPPEESQVSVNSTTTTDLPPVSASETSLPSSLPSESSSIGNETLSASEPTATPTDLPVSSGLPSDISDVSDLVSSTVPPAVATSTTEVPSTVTTEDAVTSAPPPNTWLPDTIIAEQSTPTAVPTFPGASGSTDVAMPSDLPQAIGPDKPDEGQPEGTRLLQVGFLYAENYQFVTEEPMAAAQIFTYLPEALAHGAQIDISKVRVVRLVPFDTRASLGYITTLARFYYPESMVDKLRMDVRYPNSLLYNHDDPLVYNLTSNINSAIDIIPGNEIEPNAPGSDGGSPDSNPGNTNILGNSESESTPIQKGTAAAIGIGAVSVAAAYGAAMFLVARRYKQKKQAHRRSSSIANSSEMRYAGNGSPAMMGGALLSRDFTGYGYGGMAGGRNSHGSGRSGAGNSVRTAQISAPVAAENSLGWN